MSLPPTLPGLIAVAPEETDGDETSFVLLSLLLSPPHAPSTAAAAMATDAAMLRGTISPSSPRRPPPSIVSPGGLKEV